MWFSTFQFHDFVSLNRDAPLAIMTQGHDFSVETAFTEP